MFHTLETFTLIPFLVFCSKKFALKAMGMTKKKALQGKIQSHALIANILSSTKDIRC